MNGDATNQKDFRKLQKVDPINESEEFLVRTKDEAELFIINFYDDIMKNADTKVQLIQQMKDDEKLKEYIRNNNPGSEYISENIILPMVKFILHMESHQDYKDKALKMEQDETGTMLTNAMKKTRFYETTINGVKRDPFTRETDQGYKDMRDTFIRSALKIYFKLQTRKPTDVAVEKLVEIIKRESDGRRKEKEQSLVQLIEKNGKENLTIADIYKAISVKPEKDKLSSGERKNVEIMAKRAVVLLRNFNSDRREIINEVNKGEEDKILEFINERLTNKELTYNQLHILKDLIRSIVLFKEGILHQEEIGLTSRKFINMTQRDKIEFVSNMFEEYSSKLKSEEIKEKKSFNRSIDEELLASRIEMACSTLDFGIKMDFREKYEKNRGEVNEDKDEQKLKKIKIALCDRTLTPEETESNISKLEEMIAGVENLRI